MLSTFLGHGVKTFNWVCGVVTLSICLGITDLLYRSFIPEFNVYSFRLLGFSLTLVVCIVGSCPILTSGLNVKKKRGKPSF